MKKNTVQLFWLVLLAATLVLSSLACAFSGNLREGTVDITLDEDMLNRMLREDNKASDDGADLLKDITAVDMQDGIIRVIGVYDTPAGEEAEGSYDVATYAENGELRAELVAVNMEGVSMDDPRIERVNAELTRELAETAAENRGEVEFTNVEVTEDGLKISLKLNLQR
jgi:hypothetical protein